MSTTKDATDISEMIIDNQTKDVIFSVLLPQEICPLKALNRLVSCITDRENQNIYAASISEQ